MGDTQIWWLNLTNAAMGIGVLVCALAVVGGVLREFMPRRRRH